MPRGSSRCGLSSPPLQLPPATPNGSSEVDSPVTFPSSQDTWLLPFHFIMFSCDVTNRARGCSGGVGVAAALGSVSVPVAAGGEGLRLLLPWLCPRHLSHRPKPTAELCMSEFKGGGCLKHTRRHICSFAPWVLVTEPAVSSP